MEYSEVNVVIVYKFCAHFKNSGEFSGFYLIIWKP